jgi:transcriptional regulator with XRE-family HTH domain
VVHSPYICRSKAWDAEERYSTTNRFEFSLPAAHLIYRLSFLGWTQQEIADVVGLKRQRVQQIANNTNFSKICNSIASGKSISETAEFYGLDLRLSSILEIPVSCIPNTSDDYSKVDGRHCFGDFT